MCRRGAVVYTTALTPVLEWWELTLVRGNGRLHLPWQCQRDDCPEVVIVDQRHRHDDVALPIKVLMQMWAENGWINSLLEY